ncbi:hypothetical protein EDB19DRAFT_1089167 [Suillus lakei]|nr:hypothetical protein EDB19DRAFT_1089167 [Suillus lakei]
MLQVFITVVERDEPYLPESPLEPLTRLCTYTLLVERWMPTRYVSLYLLSPTLRVQREAHGLWKLHYSSPPSTEARSAHLGSLLALLRDYPGTRPRPGGTELCDLIIYPSDQMSLAVSLSNHAWFAGMLSFSNHARFTGTTKFAGIIALFHCNHLADYRTAAPLRRTLFQLLSMYHIRTMPPLHVTRLADLERYREPSYQR